MFGPTFTLRYLIDAVRLSGVPSLSCDFSGRVAESVRHRPLRDLSPHDQTGSAHSQNSQRITQPARPGNWLFVLTPARIGSRSDGVDWMARIHAVSFGLRTRQCPLCGGEHVLRSKRRGVLEWSFLFLLLLRPFRCRQCGARHLGFFFRRRRPSKTTPELADPAEE